jgi:hypothetical protein
MLTLGCDMFKSNETLITEKAWAEFREKLKSPSTAKLVSGQVYESKDKADNLKTYIKSNFLIESLARNIDLLKIANRSPTINDKNIDKVKNDIIIETKQFDDKHLCAGLGEELFNKKTCKEVSKVLVADLNSVTKQETDNLAKNATLKFYTVCIDYDAQNSYGAVLRGETFGKVIETDSGYIRIVDFIGQ